MSYRVLCLVMLLLLISNTVWAQEPKQRFTISKQTTYITSPLRADGRVDYIGALSQMLREGVTPENNSEVMFRRALGHQGIKPTIADEYFSQLGIEVLPKDGNYLIDLGKFLRKQAAAELPDSGSKPDDVLEGIYRQWREAKSRPWTREEFPIIARWIDTNEIPLEFAVEGAARSRFFVPLLPQDRSLSASVLPGPLGFCEFAELLNTRAMLRLGEGETDAAWLDVMASHRIARLLLQGPTMMSTLVATAIESMTCVRDDKIAIHGNVNAERYLAYLEDLQRIESVDLMGEKPDLTDRYYLLDLICVVSQMDADKFAKGSPFLFSVDTEDEERLTVFIKHAVDQQLIDWNDILRKANDRFEQLTVATHSPTRMQRALALRRLDTELADAAKSAADLFRMTIPDDQKIVTNIVGNMLLAELIGPMLDFETATLRSAMRTQLSYCAFALAAWKDVYGIYPEKTGQLVPDFLKTVPMDLFTGESLTYRRTETGYLLYSVGPNLQDDGGLRVTETDEADDISIRTPDEDLRINAVIGKPRTP